MSKYFLAIIIIFSIFGFSVLKFSFAQQTLPAPKILEEARTMGEKILFGFPEVFKKVWQQALTLWKKMINYISPWFKNLWQYLSSFLGKEVEKRKPEIEEEFEKEKKEMREEIPKVSKSLWQRFKELIK